MPLCTKSVFLQGAMKTSPAACQLPLDNALGHNYTENVATRTNCQLAVMPKKVERGLVSKQVGQLEKFTSQKFTSDVCGQVFETKTDIRTCLYEKQMDFYFENFFNLRYDEKNISKIFELIYYKYWKYFSYIHQNQK